MHAKDQKWSMVLWIHHLDPQKKNKNAGAPQSRTGISAAPPPHFFGPFFEESSEQRAATVVSPREHEPCHKWSLWMEGSLK